MDSIPQEKHPTNKSKQPLDGNKKRRPFNEEWQVILIPYGFIDCYATHHFTLLWPLYIINHIDSLYIPFVSTTSSRGINDYPFVTYRSHPAALQELLPRKAKAMAEWVVEVEEVLVVNLQGVVEEEVGVPYKD